MNHFYFTLFYICTFYILVAFGLDGISFVTQCLLMFFLQYKFYMLHIEPANPYEYVQQCTYCKRMTPQHYVHCDKCKKCVPVLFEHQDDIEICADKKAFRVYIAIKRMIMIEQILVYLITSFVHPFLLIVPTTYIYLLYKTLKRV
jgi:hypothetical protein